MPVGEPKQVLVVYCKFEHLKLNHASMKHLFLMEIPDVWIQKEVTGVTSPMDYYKRMK